MRKVFLDDLPRKGNRIYWKGCVGYSIRFVYDDLAGSIKIVNYIGGKNGMLVVEYVGYKFEIGIGEFKSGRIGRILKRYTKDFKFNIGQTLKENKRNLIIIDREYREKIQKPDEKGRIYISNLKWYKYKCLICNNEDWIEESCLNKGVGCNACSKYGKKVIPEINSIYAKAPWMMKWISEEDAKKYTPQSGSKVKVTCPDCGEEKHVVISKVYRYKSISCKICSDGISYPEKFMISLLKHLSINFKTQYSPDYLGNKRSDFYLPDKNVVIETDGGLNHKNGKYHTKSKKTLEEYIEIDKWKDEQHKLHGVETIRIDCFESNMEYIKNNILKSKLKEMFDLSKVDWLKCEEFALSSRTKEVCEYWNNKKDKETTRGLAEYFNLSQNTIINYLKKGTKLGWCDYNPKEEMAICGKISGENLGRRILIFKDDVCLGEFQSISKLIQNSQELFGVKLVQSSISQVANGLRKTHKGFTFKYVENNE